MNGHRGSVTCLDSFDVNTIVSGSEDKTIRIWDVRTRKCVQGIMSFSHAINSISIIGNTLYASAGNVIRAFDLRKNALVVKECLFESQPQSEEVNKLHSFSSNSLISCNDLGEVIKYSLSLQESEIICKHNELCQAVACNDTFIASGGNDCLVKIMKDERILKEIDTSRFREETAMVFNPPFVTDLLCIQDNLIVGLGNGTLAKYNFNTGNISSVKGHDYSVSKMYLIMLMI